MATAMSKSGRRLQRRAVTQMRPREAALGQLRVVEDPITVGPDHAIHIDVGKLVAPSNVYDADYAWIVHSPRRVSLFFGKRDLGAGTGFRTRLEIRYPVENLVYHFWRNSRDFHAKLRLFAAKWPHDEERDGVVPADWVAARDHSDWSNFEAMAHAGTEATIDFYRLPPMGLARFSRGQGSAGLQVVPVVRVQITTFELLRLLDSTAEVVSAIEKYLPVHEAGVERGPTEE